MPEKDADLLRHQRDLIAEHREDLDDFAALGDELCSVIEDLGKMDTYEFLSLLDDYLPSLYAASRRLPSVAAWFLSPYEDDWDLPATASGNEEVELRQDLITELEDRLGELNWYRGVIDPYEHMSTNDPESALVPVLTLSLAADIAEVDWVLRSRLRRYREGTDEATVESAIEWRYAFDGPTGSHVTAAIRAIWSLVNDHAEDLWVDVAEGEDAPEQ